MEHIKASAAEVQEKLQRLSEKASDPTRRGSECAFCKGTGFKREGSAVRPCECRQQRIREARLSALPERFRTATFGNYVPIDAIQERALNCLSDNPAGSFFLFGDYARGKTHLASAQYRALVDSGHTVAWRSMGELLEELRRAAVNDETSTVVQAIRYSDVFHLFIDDIDKFKTTEFKHEVLFEVFDALYRRHLGVTVTSNYGLRFLAETERVHPAIIRRIDDMCRVVEV